MSAAGAAAAGGGGDAEVQRLVEENAMLEAEIAALRARLDVAQKLDMAEEKRVRAVFDLFDKDNNGVLDREEFELLAFECGSDISAMTREHVDATFRALNTSGDGKIKYAEFFRWLQQDRRNAHLNDDGVVDLQLDLRAKVWARYVQKLQQAASDSKKANNTSSSSSSSGGGAAAKADDSDEKVEKPTKSASAADSGLPLTNFAVSVGEFDEAKTSVKLTNEYDAAGAAKLEEEVEKPEDASGVIVIDLATVDDVDEMELAELCGMVEVILDNVPWDKLPVQAYHSHEFDVHEDEETGKQTLRIVLFSTVDAGQLARVLADPGHAIDPKLQANSKFELNIESPLDLDRFASDKTACLSQDDLALRIQILTRTAPDLVDKLKGLADSLPGAMQLQVRINLALLNFVRTSQFQLALANPSEWANRPDLIELFPSAKAAIDHLCSQPIGGTVDAIGQQVVRQLASQRELYKAVRTCVKGPESIRVCASGIIVQLGFQGFNLGQFLPEME